MLFLLSLVVCSFFTSGISVVCHTPCCETNGESNVFDLCPLWLTKNRGVDTCYVADTTKIIKWSHSLKIQW